jgi:tRNA-dihydrouridine synthase A
MSENRMTELDRRLSVAPMMDWTDRHQRMLMRALAPRTLLYTEMVTTGAILFGDRERHLAFDGREHPVALQLGGSEADALARSAAIGHEYGYDEINLNCGCPSDRVQSGAFGACLMAEPEHVAELVAAMVKASPLPVTVKTRIGIDDSDTGPFLDRFIDQVADAGCRSFTIHARKAWLKGLSPKENRDVPPLDYARARALKARRPDLEIILNGGLETVEAMQEALRETDEGPALDGVMIGREAYQNPLIMVAAEAALFGTSPREVIVSEVLEQLGAYVAERLEAGTPLKSITRHMMGLMNGKRGARGWRRLLSAVPQDTGITWERVIEEARRLESTQPEAEARAA